MKCNIFNPLDKNNGEFYLFTQYADDCTKEDALKTSYRVVPSRFAALNITLPKVEDLNNYIAETFQDYENRVLFLKGQREWSPEMANNLLWECMEEAGFVTATNYTTTTGDTTMTTFHELNFIGDINIYNAKRYNDMNYNEIYCHIGSSDRSKYYAVERVGTKEMYEYEGLSLLGWEGLTVLPNATENTARVREGKYGLFGNYLPNMLNSEYTDRSIDVPRPSSAEDVTVNIKQEGLGTVFFQVGSGELEPVTFNDGEEYTFHMSNDVREVTIYPNTQNIFIDGKVYAQEDVNMTGIGTVYQNTEKGILIDPQVGSIRITNNNEDSFKLNTIILFYDIYNNLDADNPQLLYKNIPMGVYFVGKYDEDAEELRNTVTKYSNNDDVFGQGSSYNLRLCTRNVVTPQGMLKYDTQVVGGEEGYDNLSSVMGGLHDLITSTKSNLHSNAIEQQDVRDHLSNFKNYRTNVPYIRKVNGIDTWFVNGKNTGVQTSPRGIQGIQGVQGMMGYAGKNGVQGAQGVQGIAGKDGSGEVNVEYLGGKSSSEYLIELGDTSKYVVIDHDSTSENQAVVQIYVQSERYVKHIIRLNSLGDMCHMVIGDKYIGMRCIININDLDIHTDCSVEITVEYIPLNELDRNEHLLVVNVGEPCPLSKK